MATTPQPETDPRHGWVLYDNACDFCRRWVPRFEGTLYRRGYAIAPLQADWVRERLDVSNDELIADVRLLRRDGDQITGADVYRHCMRRIWWTWPLWLLSVLPGTRQLFDRTYRTFARNRYCISGASGIPAEED
jgi:predicted DCC family thiol-disulfide oxidoreductase YuxK